MGGGLCGCEHMFPKPFATLETSFDPCEMGKEGEGLAPEDPGTGHPHRAPSSGHFQDSTQRVPKAAFLPHVTECMTGPSPGKDNTTPNFTPRTTPSPNGYPQIFVIYSLTSH